jgi:hypothetical protein
VRVGCANSIGDERVLFPVWQVDASSFVRRLPCLWSHLNLVVVAVVGQPPARVGCENSIGCPRVALPGSSPPAWPLSSG